MTESEVTTTRRTKTHINEIDAERPGVEDEVARVGSCPPTTKRRSVTDGDQVADAGERTLPMRREIERLRAQNGHKKHLKRRARKAKNITRTRAYIAGRSRRTPRIRVVCAVRTRVVVKTTARSARNAEYDDRCGCAHTRRWCRPPCPRG